MTEFMLDTNIVSTFIHARSQKLDRQIAETTSEALCVSIITFGETAFGLAKRPGATKLATAANNLFSKIKILEFDFNAGATYGSLRALMEKRGTPLGPLDMLIAAHAVSVGATLVSNDRAFRMVPNLQVEDWTQA
jgi:tRNA(fMet)-specific endonuclease VapC